MLIRADGRDVGLIGNIYWNQETTVNVEDETLDWQKIERIRQGRVMSTD